MGALSSHVSSELGISRLARRSGALGCLLFGSARRF
jgi:hypothetical protein